MRTIKIPKGNGKFRLVYVPDPKLKASLRSLASQIARKAERASPDGVVHGFTRLRSPITNALAHVGHKFTLRFDLKDFFDSVKEIHLAGKLTKEELSLVLVEGAARQGLPTSPACANLAAAALDKAILKFRDRAKLQFVYTRYADDLTFSFDDLGVRSTLEGALPEIVGRCGFRINESKTRFQAASAGRRIITGVAVDDLIHPTRAAKRRLRAAIHQQNKAKAEGLSEWCRLKSPKDQSVTVKTASELDAITKAWRLPRLNVDKLPAKGEDESLSEGIIISGDPVYMLGMSTWTTGWTSCMSQPNGRYRKGVLFWCHLRGTRIAALLSERTKVIAGVERKLMRARALIHKLKNGVAIYDRLYGNPEDCVQLKKCLEGAGFLSVQLARNDFGPVRVLGNAPERYEPYLDSLRSSTIVVKGRKARIVSL